MHEKYKSRDLKDKKLNNGIAPQFLGRLGEVAASAALIRLGIEIEEVYLDYNRNREPDIYMFHLGEKIGAEVKSCQHKDWFQLGRYIPERQVDRFDDRDILIWCTVPIVIVEFNGLDPIAVEQELLPNGITVEVAGFSYMNEFFEKAVKIDVRGRLGLQAPMNTVHPLKELAERCGTYMSTK